MNCKKTVLAELQKPYAVRAVEIEGRSRFFAASEERHGECLLFEPPDYQPELVWDAPGGCMSIAGLGTGSGSFLAIQNFFPVFASEDAAIVHVERTTDAASDWRVQRIIDLPFVHRFEVFQHRGIWYLIAATLCAKKDFQDDWSHPGSVHVATVPADPKGPWPLTTVLNGVSKNHGMHLTRIKGQTAVLICGEQGLFALYPPDGFEGYWHNEKLLDHEISDVYCSDLDGDGQNELVTIEPFHGNKLAIYKRQGNNYREVYAMTLDFGHVVWAGTILDRPGIIAGNRGGDKDLFLMTPRSAGSLDMEKTVLDSGVGAAQIAVVNLAKRTLVFSANHGIDEVALYEIT